MTPLVMVHGFMGGGAQWDGEVAALSDSHEVIALDLPGFGRNADLEPINTIGGFADWVTEQLEKRGVRQFHLLGHSMGGMIVQDIARKVPDRIASLILYATGAKGVLPGRFETIAQSKARAQTDGARTTARRIAATWFLRGDAAPGYASCAAIAERATLPAIMAGLDAMEGWSGEAALAALRPKTLIIWGDCDRTYAWAQTEQLWKTIPNTRLAVVPACAHAVHLEKPDLFAALLQDHLSHV
ncbi:alpha/beta fold hydrolase [uncultured Tateyamaria sp.]|uniref:alpha/beta fold hydrolase n=1 Tax=uncultured Tateyamaria sp. TaxID=455651 RepID=UPI002615A3E3|nr:alpha/beta fold hydrolase [uncultured Tateyamaria sp.]